MNTIPCCQRLLLLAAAACASLGVVTAQEQLPRAEALKYAFLVSVNLNDMLQTPIPTDPDVKRPIAVREGDYGALLMPESKLNADTFAKAGKDSLAVGQLWLHKLVPMTDGRPVPSSKLYFVKVADENTDTKVPCCALGVRKAAGGELELVVFGKEKEPVLSAPLHNVTRSSDKVIELTAERKDDGGLVTVRFLGKFEASFMVTDPEQF